MYSLKNYKKFELLRPSQKNFRYCVYASIITLAYSGIAEVSRFTRKFKINLLLISYHTAKVPEEMNNFYNFDVTITIATM